MSDCTNCGNDDWLDGNDLCKACVRAFNLGFEANNYWNATNRECERILKIMNDRLHISEFTSGVCNCYECVEIRTIIHEITTVKEPA